MASSGSVQASDRIRALCQHIRRNISTLEEDHDPRIIDELVVQLDMLIYHLNQLRAVPQEDVVSLANVHSIMVTLRDEEHHSCSLLNSGMHISQMERREGRGRPRYHITEEQLASLLQLNFTCGDMATMLGVSLRTIRRRMSEYNLSVRAYYTDIDDSGLDHAISELKGEFPNCGYRIMDGLLRQQGIRVTQFCLREAMHRVDTNGVTVRFADFIHRRRYHVSGPQALWHMDGNHKLIR